MKYEDFIEVVREKMQEELGKEVQVQLHRIMKNNSVVLDGMSICRERDSVSPTIYLNDFYRDYENGMELADILRTMKAIYESSRENVAFQAGFYTDFSKVKERLACRLVSREKNTELLKYVPHREFLDLAVVVYYCFEDEKLGTGTILVYESHLANWGVSAQELLEIARENTRRILPEEFMGMRQLLEKHQELPEEEETDNGMYVLTNAGNYFGAVYMMYDSVLQEIGEQLGTDFWVLPSSVHECIIVPDYVDMDRQELEDMVREINRSEVDAEEFLSDEVYFYQRKMHRLTV